MIRFFSRFGDRCHHSKEERFFFPAIEKYRLPFDQDKIDILVEEHEQGRGYVAAMKEQIENFRKARKAGNRRRCA
ncbi:MAG: hemerythrin domain-containing protein [Sediminispirochaetaceae bacterium]